MKFALKILLTLFCVSANAQQNAANYGYRHFQMRFRNENVDLLVKSKTGDENTTKPLFLFCQGSLPQPLLKIDESGAYGVFPFNTDTFTDDYHIVIIGKPSIPLICNVNGLGKDFTYVDKNGKFPEGYARNNFLAYYVERNIAVLKFLRKEKWASHKGLVVAGHSEGSTIAAKMCTDYKEITRLIYSSGNPAGRILSVVSQSRNVESDTIGKRFAEEDFKYWDEIVSDPDNSGDGNGDSNKTTYGFSVPPIEYLEKLNIPILVSYGTKDWSTPFNDYLRAETIRKAKRNFTFSAYVGTEHNYFPVSREGKVDYDVYNWDKVAEDWKKWLKNPQTKN